MILQENLATEPCVTTIDDGWIAKEEIPAAKQNSNTQLLTCNTSTFYGPHSKG